MSLWKKLGFSLMLILIIGGLGFQDVSKDPDRTIIVWQHFILDKDKEKAKCKHCGKEYRSRLGDETLSALVFLKQILASFYSWISKSFFAWILAPFFAWILASFFA